MKYLWIVLLIFLVSCSDISNPKAVATEYTKLKFSLNEESYDYLTKDERKFAESILEDAQSSVDNYFGEKTKSELGKIILSTIEIDFVSQRENDNKTEVTLMVKSLDYSQALSEMWSERLKGMFNSDSSDFEPIDFGESFISKVKSNQTLSEKLVTVSLINEDGNWRVIDGWKDAFLKAEEIKENEKQRQKEAAEREAKRKVESEIRQLIHDAKDLARKKDFASASTKVVSALELDPESEDALSYSATLKSEIELEKELQEYIPFIEIIEFDAKYYESRYYGTVPGVKFGLKNNGDRSLSRVKVTVYFYDKNGNAIYEDDYVPIYERNYSGLSELKPNYINRMEKNEFYRVEGLGPEWSGKAEAIVTEIEFAD